MTDFKWHDNPEWVESYYGTPKPPEEQFDRLNQLLDETRGENSDRGLDDPSSINLGKVQKHILIAISKLSKPNPVLEHFPDWYFDEDGPTWADRSEVTKTAYTDGYHPSSENALRAGVSRAIHKLCEKGLVHGVYRAWGMFVEGEMTYMHGAGPKPWSNNFERNPTLQYITLTTEGWDTVYSLIHARINNESGD